MLILIVDDEQMQREMLHGFLEKQGYEVLTASGGHEALHIFASAPVQLVLMDHRMEDMNGDEVLAKMRAASPLVRAVMITAFGDVTTAVKVMQLGADDFMEKPVDLTELLEKIRRIEQSLNVQEESQKITETLAHVELPISIISSSKPMQELLSLVYRIAPTEWAALIHGETGTGKELVARLIHLMGPRKDGPFVEVNCAAIPENLFESELFGHEKGAFTGAVAKRRGRFELAAGGTLFLDEVGELPLHLQAKLLRTLQEKKVTRVGSETDIDVDARVLTATNRNLKQMVAEGSFREDLFFRLNVLELVVPPLRERRDDIVELAEFFLEKYSPTNISFANEAMAQLVKYRFPGNVRELEHLVQRMVTLVRGNRIGVSDLPPEIRESQSKGGLLSERLAEVEKDMMMAALDEHHWIQTKAADALGISERVLRYKMNKAGIKK
ncbi:MAG: sigma-54 dependent transcriptional regulator [Thermodesulfobacteriota bacterium]|nr:sigma-54 dependent transcriptional regulator [Thermodesulfobacteriota bacterium]